MKNENKSNPNDIHKTKIKKVFILSFIYFLFEFFIGIYSNSLGLLSDSIHMLFDTSTLIISYYCLIYENKKPTTNFPYKLKKLEFLASFLNSLALIYVSFNIIKESIYRLIDPVHVKGYYIIGVSILGIIINSLGLLFFKEDFHYLHSHDHEHDEEFQEININKLKIDNDKILDENKTIQDEIIMKDKKTHSHSHLNIQSIIIHLIGDLFGSLSLVISSLLIIYFNYYKFDSIASIIISLLIFYNSLKILINSYSKLTNKIDNKLIKEEINKFSNILKNCKEINDYNIKENFNYGSNKIILIVNIILNKNINLIEFKKYFNLKILEFQNSSSYIKNIIIDYLI